MISQPSKRMRPLKTAMIRKVNPEEKSLSRRGNIMKRGDGKGYRSVLALLFSVGVMAG